MSRIYGYIRVSTFAQRDDRQQLALREYGIPQERIFVDGQSGRDFARPAYRRLLRALRKGDTLVVKSLDRLGRSYEEMLKEIRLITKEKEVELVILDLPLLSARSQYGDDLTTKLITSLVLQVFSYVAELERTMNHQRTLEGLAAARARGVRLGRPPMEKPAAYRKIRVQWARKELSARKAATALGVSAPTFLKWAKEDGDDTQV